MPFSIIRNDITRVKADAIVNTANPRPVVGRGTDSAVYAAAGYDELLSARREIGGIAPGQAASTPAFALRARYIIHTVGPVWTDGAHGEGDTLRSCYKSSLALAKVLGCRSVAFPLISTGVYGFPRNEALRIALSEIEAFLFENDMDVILVVFDRASLEVSEKLTRSVEQFIDEHGVSLARKAEYPGTFDGEGSQAQRMNAPCGLPEAGLEDEEDSSADDLDLYETEERPAPKYNAIKRAFTGFTAPRKKVSIPRNVISPAETEKHLPDSERTDDSAFDALAPEHIGMSAFASLDDIKHKSLDELLSNAGDSFQKRLFKLIDERGLDDVTVYKRANIDRKLFSRIRCKTDYVPKKRTALAFAIALKLDMPTTVDLLSRAGIALSPGNRFDLIITYFITHGIYDMFEINATLFRYEQPILGE